jgi:hypothetical protein
VENVDGRKLDLPLFPISNPAIFFWRFMMDRIAFMTVGISLGVLFLSGCATVEPSGYLKNYDQLKAGKYIERIWSDPDKIAQGQYKGIVIGQIESRVADSVIITREDTCNWLRSAIFRGDISIKHMAFGAETGKKVKLDLAITEMTPGSAFARMMAGEFGAGTAKVQIEGRVTDEESGVLLVSFADRRSGSGAMGFRDLGGDSGPAMVREMITAIGFGIRSELDHAFGFK